MADAGPKLRRGRNRGRQQAPAQFGRRHRFGRWDWRLHQNRHQRSPEWRPLELRNDVVDNPLEGRGTLQRRGNRRSLAQPTSQPARGLPSSRTARAGDSVTRNLHGNESLRQCGQEAPALGGHLRANGVHAAPPSTLPPVKSAAALRSSCGKCSRTTFSRARWARARRDFTVPSDNPIVAASCS